MMSGRAALVVGTDRAAHARLRRLLREHGYEAAYAGSRAEALALLGHTPFVFTLVDAAVDGFGPQSLEPLKNQSHDPGPIIVLCRDGEIDPTVEPMAVGADRIIREAGDPDVLQRVITEIVSASPRPDAGVADESLRRQIGLWRSNRMQTVWRIIQQASRADVTVLISGETGTGKDLVARAIHHLSSRQRAPFVAVNCAAVPPDLLESELFGHERGAFTGAHQLHTGKFEAAEHGTILLDEIGELHPALQAKLLHVLQDGTFSRVGGRSTMAVDVRVLAATNRDLALAVATQRFRDDLYYRLNVIHIVVPPLRERREEIPLLAEYFIERYSKLYHHAGFNLSEETLDRLTSYSFPGNVRELENLIKRMIVLGDAGLEMPWPSSAASGKGNSPVEPRQPSAVFLKDVGRKAALRAEREEILRMLDQTHWNRRKTAKLLNISYRSLLYKMKDAGLARISTNGLSL